MLSLNEIVFIIGLLLTLAGTVMLKDVSSRMRFLALEDEGSWQRATSGRRRAYAFLITGLIISGAVYKLSGDTVVQQLKQSISRIIK
jgi:hypothetical protein